MFEVRFERFSMLDNKIRAHVIMIMIMTIIIIIIIIIQFFIINC